MSNSYSVTTLLTELPAEHVHEWHRCALKALGFSMDEQGIEEGDSSHGGGRRLYIYTDNGDVGPCDLDASVDGAFEDLDLEQFADTPFIKKLVEDMQERGGVSWDEVIQRVLRDIPEDAGISCVDVQGGYWCDKARPGEFGGYALRITRDVISTFNISEAFTEIFADGDDAAAGSSSSRRLLPRFLKTEDVIVKVALDYLLGNPADDVSSDVDAAVANAISRAFDAIGVTEPSTMTDELGDLHDRTRIALDLRIQQEEEDRGGAGLVATAELGQQQRQM